MLHYMTKLHCTYVKNNFLRTGKYSLHVEETSDFLRSTISPLRDEKNENQEFRNTEEGLIRALFEPHCSDYTESDVLDSQALSQQLSVSQNH